MFTTRRLFSLSILGVMALTLVPIASAHGSSMHFSADVEGNAHGGRYTINNGVRARLGHKFKSKIEVKCGERKDTEEWRMCAKNAKSEVKVEWKENHPKIFRPLPRRHIDAGISAELKAELKACHEKDTAEARRTCILDVMTKIRAELKAKADSDD